jgi:cytochrome c oxidase assembly protein subunit 11
MTSRRWVPFTLVGLAFGMLGLSFASAPLYRLFCQVTGYGGTTGVASAAPGRTKESRRMTIRFDANVNTDLAWKFKPAQASQEVIVGESSLAFYEATNRSDQDTWGTATFNVTPLEAGSYFVKTDCFCFEAQKLAAGESVDMPVAFYIEPELEDDPYLQDVTTITLSYTFFPIPKEDWPEEAQ